MAREALIERNTKEKQIRLQLNIDGTGSSDIDTGIGFFDHMLTLFAFHSKTPLELGILSDSIFTACFKARPKALNIASTL